MKWRNDATKYRKEALYKSRDVILRQFEATFVKISPESIGSSQMEFGMKARLVRTPFSFSANLCLAVSTFRWTTAV